MHMSQPEPFGAESTSGANASARRKLQNRLNQRAFRRRRAAAKADKVLVFELESDDASPKRRAPEEHELLRSSLQFSQQPKLSVDLPEAIESTCRPFQCVLKAQVGLLAEDLLSDEESSVIIAFEESFSEKMKPLYLTCRPTDDHILSLTYYNVFRALVINTLLLGLDPQRMHLATYPSPFVDSTAAYERHLPPHLRPTLLQQMVPHHPCFDVFPDPVLRDHAIARADVLSPDLFVMSLAGRVSCVEDVERSPARRGVMVWGSPEDVDSWELTEHFVMNWYWLVKGSQRLERSTNKRRIGRGEPPIYFT